MDTGKYAPLIEELDRLIWKTEKRKNYLFVFFMLGGGFFLFYLLSIGMALLLRDNPVPIWMQYCIIFLGLTVVPALFIIGIIKLIERKSENLKSFIGKTKSILYKYEYWKVIPDDIEALLLQTKEIHETLLFVYGYYKKNKDTLGEALYPFIKDYEYSTLKALYDIRTDLLKQAEYRKENISRAQDMLRHPNLKGIHHISEAQSIRLNGQIQQFEALGKILVKV